MDLTIRRMHAIFNAGVINNDMWLGQPDESHFRALCEQIGVIGAYDYALYSSLVDHMIAANALLTQGSPEQVARYRDEVIQMRAVYAFGCTEIASAPTCVTSRRPLPTILPGTAWCSTHRAPRL